MCGQRWAPRMDPTSGQQDSTLASRLDRHPARQPASQARQQPTTRGGAAAAENNENLLAGNCVLVVALHRTLPGYPVESFRQITFFCKIFHLKTKHKAQRVARERRERDREKDSAPKPQISESLLQRQHEKHSRKVLKSSCAVSLPLSLSLSLYLSLSLCLCLI